MSSHPASPHTPQTPPLSSVSVDGDDPLAPTPTDPSAGEVDETTRLRDELTAMRDHMLRALAEADNTRKRAEKDRDDILKYSIGNFARDLLSVADNLRRALETVGPEDTANDRIAGLIAGVEATERDLLKAFDKHGLKKIEPIDEPFNPNFHEVMFEIPGTGKPAATITQVMEAGYILHDRLLRPARVGVAKGEAGEPPPRTLDEQA